MTVVVDASVAIKWFIQEPLRNKARHLIQSGELLSAPDFLFVELANVVWKLALRRDLERRQAEAIISSVGNMFLFTLSSGALRERALEIALTLRHPVYDCFYLACAESLEAELVTADSRFHAAVQNSDFAGRVIHLTALPDAPP